MTNPNPATSAGPNRDGSKSLAKESKAGIAVTFLTGAAALAVLGFLDQKVDVSTFPGWLQGAATYVVAGIAGLATAYAKKNR